jgi:hypothetical protein
LPPRGWLSQQQRTAKGKCKAKWAGRQKTKTPLGVRQLQGRELHDAREMLMIGQLCHGRLSCLLHALHVSCVAVNSTATGEAAAAAAAAACTCAANTIKNEESARQTLQINHLNCMAFCHCLT